MLRENYSLKHKFLNSLARRPQSGLFVAAEREATEFDKFSIHFWAIPFETADCPVHIVNILPNIMMCDIFGIAVRKRYREKRLTENNAKISCKNLFGLWDKTTSFDVFFDLHPNCFSALISVFKKNLVSKNFSNN